jgi:oxygen-independent coproporphyrinogen III oxidase
MTSSYSIYIHIPFCRHICTYCAFNTYADMDDSIQPFVDALCKEIAFVGKSKADLSVHTVFFGGGTPSMLSITQFGQILGVIKASFVLDKDAEITIEANPNDLTHDYLIGLREVGIDRLSVGMQSSNERELKLYERQHSHEITIEAIALARQAGFKNISLDLIFGNPEQTIDEWQATLEKALDLKPQHISLYGLEVKGGTVLKKQIQQGLVHKPNDDLAADMYELADETMQQAGLRQYEISNWSLQGFQARHNLQYWHNLPYLGLGAGAHGYANQTRTIVIRHPGRYIQAMNGTNLKEFPRSPATSKATLVDEDTEISETIMVGMRLTEEGIQRKTFFERFGVDVYEIRKPTIDKYVGLGMVLLDADCVRFSQAGRLLSNLILSELI